MSTAPASVDRARRWAFLPVGLLGLLVSTQLLLLHYATAGDHLAIEEHYYEKAMGWDAVMAQAKRNAQLGWQLSMNIADEPRSRAARARIVDSGGKPVSGAIVSVEAFSVSRGRALRPKVRESTPGTYVFDLPINGVGLWEFRFHAERAADLFTSRVRQDLHQKAGQE